MDSEIYIVAGFRVDRQRTVYYRKCRDLGELYEAVATAFIRRNADFISIRKVKIKG